MHEVTVSMWPDKTIKVDDRELADLKAQGLLVETVPAKTAKPRAVSDPKEN